MHNGIPLVLGELFACRELSYKWRRIGGKLPSDKSEAYTWHTQG